MRLFAVILFLAASPTQGSEFKSAIVARPSTGEVSVAPTGSIIFERFNAESGPAVKPSAGATKTEDMIYKLKIEAGETLAIVQDGKKVIACQYAVEMPLCLIDRDLDGTFEAANAAGGLYPKKLKEPIPYQRGFTAMRPPSRDQFRQQLSFLGLSGSTLRLSYKEFLNDLARPAFTDEVTFNMPGTYPETIAYKDVVIEVLGINNAGLQYVVKKADSGAQ